MAFRLKTKAKWFLRWGRNAFRFRFVFPSCHLKYRKDHFKKCIRGKNNLLCIWAFRFAGKEIWTENQSIRVKFWAAVPSPDRSQRKPRSLTNQKGSAQVGNIRKSFRWKVRTSSTIFGGDYAHEYLPKGGISNQRRLIFCGHPTKRGIPEIRWVSRKKLHPPPPL